MEEYALNKNKENIMTNCEERSCTHYNEVYPANCSIMSCKGIVPRKLSQKKPKVKK